MNVEHHDRTTSFPSTPRPSRLKLGNFGKLLDEYND